MQGPARHHQPHPSTSATHSLFFFFHLSQKSLGSWMAWSGGGRGRWRGRGKRAGTATSGSEQESVAVRCLAVISLFSFSCLLARHQHFLVTRALAFQSFAPHTRSLPYRYHLSPHHLPSLSCPAGRRAEAAGPISDRRRTGTGWW